MYPHSERPATPRASGPSKGDLLGQRVTEEDRANKHTAQAKSDALAHELAKKRWHWHAQVLKCCDLPSVAKVVAGGLIGFVNEDSGKAWPSHKTLAKRCGITDRHVRNGLKLLERRKFLYIRNRKGGVFSDGNGGLRGQTCDYRLSLPDEGGTTFPCTAIPGTNEGGNPEQNGGVRGKESGGSRNSSSYKPSKEPSTKPNTKPSNESADALFHSKEEQEEPDDSPEIQPEEIYDIMEAGSIIAEYVGCSPGLAASYLNRLSQDDRWALNRQARNGVLTVNGALDLVSKSLGKDVKALLVSQSVAA